MGKAIAMQMENFNGEKVPCRVKANIKRRLENRKASKEIRRTLSLSGKEPKASSFSKLKFQQSSFHIQNEFSRPWFHGSDQLHFSLRPPVLMNLPNDRQLWLDKKIAWDVGCLLTVAVAHSPSDSAAAGTTEGIVNANEAFKRVNRLTYLTDALQVKVATWNSTVKASDFKKALHELICSQQDSMDDIVRCSCRLQRSNSRLVGGREVEIWASKKERRFSFLQRLAQPICAMVTESSSEETPSLIAKLDYSMLDLLLRNETLQKTVVDALLVRVCMLQSVSPSSAGLKKLEMSLLDSIKSAHMMPTLFIDSVARAFSLNPTDRQKRRLQRVFGFESAAFEARLRLGAEENLPIEWTKHLTNKKSRKGRKRSYPETYHNALQRRDQLVTEYHKKRRTGNGSFQNSVYRSSGVGPLTKGPRDMSFEAFLKETRFMAKVTPTIPRPFFPDKSRPLLRGLPLTQEQIQSLKELYFDADGSLSDSIRQDIDTSAKHGYINFQNHLCLRQRRDLRWQVPIRKHGCVSLVETRNSTEKLLREVINREVETLCDLGILIGGTEDQSLHHDTARQVVSWVPEDKTKNRVSGWEVDRLEYNAAMSSPNAPSSLILGMNKQNECLLGVQKDYVIRCDEGGVRKCRILGGTGETFGVVRENDSLVVIKANNGVMFTGDFPHAGVRNVVEGTPEDALMVKLNVKIQRVLDEYPPDDLLGQTRAVLDVLCSTPGLIKICRLHCSTEMLTGNLRIPNNTVGFSGCRPNPPDTRCLQKDDENRVDPYNNIAEDGNDSGSDEEEEFELADEEVKGSLLDVGLFQSYPEEDSVPTLYESDGQSPNSYNGAFFFAR